MRWPHGTGVESPFLVRRAAEMSMRIDGSRIGKNSQCGAEFGNTGWVGRLEVDTTKTTRGASDGRSGC